MPFRDEKEFEEAVIRLLQKHGWQDGVLEYSTEAQLIQNWADILYDHNREQSRLGNYPLTPGEKEQLVGKITKATPIEANDFINGEEVTIIRDNPNDKLNNGKEVALTIYKRDEIAAGRTRYQIVRQPRFAAKTENDRSRRGDLLLLINGMPVIHIELKRSGESVEKACRQIEKYAKENVFSGLFSLVQVFVAMTPEKMIYFANQRKGGEFNRDYYFHWADNNNKEIEDWSRICSSFLSIPRAHELIGYYTVTDNADDVLKVMRSYQIIAAETILNRVQKRDWHATGRKEQLGGYVWHTTGAGKTMTAFKAAHLIATASGMVDKVVFLVDRIELGTQSLQAFKAFGGGVLDVQATENTEVLRDKIRNANPGDKLIVTSVQKMNDIDKVNGGLNSAQLAQISKKKIVFIVDECHRTMFGENMLPHIKDTFPHALFFGFTGTPIMEENKKKGTTQTDLFGDELHRYSIADGIRDKNVLGFDTYMVLTYTDDQLKKATALAKAGVQTVAEAKASPAKWEQYRYYMNLPMCDKKDSLGNVVEKGIESMLPPGQYTRTEHRQAVVDDIKEHWDWHSNNGQFHAILATSSIPEAIEYYKLLKEKAPHLRIAALFDHTDNNQDDDNGIKQAGVNEIVEDYNNRYGRKYDLASISKDMKQDIAERLAHRGSLREEIEANPDKRLDLVIVVNQLLTGYDSKWISALYIDKMLRYEQIIQAFSRTNRLFDKNEKPHGIIRYYRRPHTMEQQINEAIDLYSGNRAPEVFVDKCEKNLKVVNDCFRKIKEIFESAGVENFSVLPEKVTDKKAFAKFFRELADHLAAARLQGFSWSGKAKKRHDVLAEDFDEIIYSTLSLRYNELFIDRQPKTGAPPQQPYDIPGFPVPIRGEILDDHYINFRFEKYIDAWCADSSTLEDLQNAKTELNKSFASLSQEKQKYAKMLLNDIENKKIHPQKGKKFHDYLNEYMTRARNDLIHRCAVTFGMGEFENILRKIVNANPQNVEALSRENYKDILQFVDIQKTTDYFENISHKELLSTDAIGMLDKWLKDFILDGDDDLPH